MWAGRVACFGAHVTGVFLHCAYHAPFQEVGPQCSCSIHKQAACMASGAGGKSPAKAPTKLPAAIANASLEELQRLSFDTCVLRGTC